MSNIRLSHGDDVVCGRFILFCDSCFYLKTCNLISISLSFWYLDLDICPEIYGIDLELG